MILEHSTVQALVPEFRNERFRDHRLQQGMVGIYIMIPGASGIMRPGASLARSICTVVRPSELFDSPDHHLKE